MTEQSSIRCMQLPMVGLQVLMPNSAVAEVISYSEPETEYKGTDWLDGLILWRGVLIPVVSLEKMCQSDFTEPGPRTRIAVLYNIDNDKDLPFVGLIMQDIPRAYLAEAERMQEVIDKPQCQYLRCKADMMMNELMIPDMDAIMYAVKDEVQKFQNKVS